MADTLQQLLRERAEQDTVAVRYGDRSWTWRVHIAEASAQAAALVAIADPGRPLHVGVLLGNTPDMLTALAAAALGGYVLCGINDTRRGAGLARDIALVDCQILLINSDNRHLLDGVELPGVKVLDTSRPEWAALIAGVGEMTPHREVTADDTFMLIFTSGHQRRPEGRPGSAHDAALLGWRAREQVRGDRVRRLLPVHAAVSFECRLRGLGRGTRYRRCDGARDLLGFAVPR